LTHLRLINRTHLFFLRLVSWHQ